MPNTSLPPELENAIIQHLSGDTHTLQRCALVSRTWSAFSQAVLFRNTKVKLFTYEMTAQLLDDLIFAPHLQTLVRDLIIYRHLIYVRYSLSAHVSCLASLLPLLPNLIKVEFEGVIFEDPYLDLIPKALGNAPFVEVETDIYSFESFTHIFRILAGTRLTRLNLSGIVSRPAGLVSTRERLDLSSLEYIRFGVEGLQKEFHLCLTQKFDLPNLKQCDIVTSFVAEFAHWRKVLLKGFPPIKVFRLELTSGFTDDLKRTNTPEEHIFRPLPLAGLPFEHIHLSVSPGNTDQTRKFINWWSSTFRAISDAQATVHFTELTFAFTYLWEIGNLQEAWNALDSSLMHATFSGLRSIHFEWSSWVITWATHPYFAAILRRCLPRLASRGLLPFV